MIIIIIKNNNNNKSTWTRNSRWQLAREIQPLGSKVKMHAKVKWKPEIKIHTTSSVAWVNKGSVPQDSQTSLALKKCATGSATSLGKHSDGNHTQGDQPAGPSRVTPTKKKKKDKELMYAFYISLEKPSGSHTENTSSTWESRNHNVKMNVNGDKLASVRRDIMNSKRLTDV